MNYTITKGEFLTGNEEQQCKPKNTVTWFAVFTCILLQNQLT